MPTQSASTPCSLTIDTYPGGGFTPEDDDVTVTLPALPAGAVTTSVRFKFHAAEGAHAAQWAQYMGSDPTPITATFNRPDGSHGYLPDADGYVQVTCQEGITTFSVTDPATLTGTLFRASPTLGRTGGSPGDHVVYDLFVVERDYTVPGPVLGKPWTLGAAAWSTVLPPVGHVRNLNATIADDPTEPAWRDWGWDPPVVGRPVSYLSVVREAAYVSGDPDDPASYTPGTWIGSYVGTSFPTITPHNLATSRPGHTGQGSMQDSVTLHGDVYRAVVMEVTALDPVLPSNPERTVSRIVITALAGAQDLEASWTANAPHPEQRWWGWSVSAGRPVDTWTSKVYEAIWDGLGSQNNPGSYSRGDLIHTHTAAASALAAFVPADAAYGINEDVSSNPSRGQNVLMDSFSIPNTGGVERYRMIWIEVYGSDSDGDSFLSVAYSKGEAFADSFHFTSTPDVGAQVGSYSLHSPASRWTLIAFRRNLSTGAVTRFQQTTSSTTVDSGSIAFDAGAGSEIAYLVAAEDESAGAPGYESWDDPMDPTWTLRWPG